MKLHLKCLALTFCLLAVLVGCHDPAKTHAQLEAARTQVIDGEYRAAIPTLTSLIESGDSIAAALLWRADCYSMLKIYDSAKADRLQILAMEEADCKQKFWAANSAYIDFLVAKSWDSCLKYKEICVQYSKQCRSQDVYFDFSSMCFPYANKHEFRLALAMADSAKYYGATAYEDAGTRSWVYRRMNELDSALKYATIAIERQSEYEGMTLPGWTYYYRGEIYALRSDLTAACADWQKALDLGLEEAKAKLDSFCLKK